MNVYAIKFPGLYPVGACAVVTAPTETAAKDMLMGQLKIEKLLGNTTKKDLDITKISTTKRGCVIVLNGDY
jgi:hypothetical protein